MYSLSNVLRTSGYHFPTAFLCRPMQRKYAAEAAHGSHASRGFPTRLHTGAKNKKDQQKLTYISSDSDHF